VIRDSCQRLDQHRLDQDVPFGEQQVPFVRSNSSKSGGFKCEGSGAAVPAGVFCKRLNGLGILRGGGGPLYAMGMEKSYPVLIFDKYLI
jgi:hypothetical protein